MAKVTIKAKPLHTWQRDVIECYDSHPNNSIIVVKSPRQRGKTYTIMILALRQAINNPLNRIYIIVPTYATARKQFKDFCKACGKIPCIGAKNQAHFEIEFTNGSFIQFLSAESGDNLRGNTADLLIFDEGAFIKLETALECFNYTNTTNGNILIFSTPTFKDSNNLFYRYFSQGLQWGGGEAETPSPTLVNPSPTVISTQHNVNYVGNVFSIDFCAYDTSQLLSKDKLETYRKTMPHKIFCNEILGEFMTADSTVFGKFERVIHTPHSISTELFMGIDFATGTNNDETAIVVMNQNREMTHLFHFNDKDSNDTIEFILNLFKELKPSTCTVEVNSLGQVYYDYLRKGVANRRLQTYVKPFTTSNSSKRDIIQNLQINIQNETCSLLDDTHLKLQFSAFEVKATPSGLITYGNSSDRIHDDIVMATALALSTTNKNTYTVR
jgi:hypothetical protein